MKCQCCPHIETSQLICTVFGFYVKATLALNGLTFSAPCISKSFLKMKIKLNFSLHISLWCLKGSFKAFLKPIETSQRSAKIEI